MPIGPRGEKRPASSIASVVHAVKVATGQIEEQYVGGKPRDEGFDQVAAMRIKRPTKPPKSRKKNRTK